MYFLKIFRLYIADQNALFDGLQPPPEVGGELVFDHKMLDPPPKVVFIASWFSLITNRCFFSLVNRKYTAKDRSGKNYAFLRAWVSSPTNKVRTTAAESTSDLEPHRQLFHKGQDIKQDVKICFNRTCWACTWSFTVTRHPSQLPDGNSGDKILDSLNFLWNCRWHCSSVFL